MLGACKVRHRVVVVASEHPCVVTLGCVLLVVRAILGARSQTVGKLVHVEWIGLLDRLAAKVEEVLVLLSLGLGLLGVVGPLIVVCVGVVIIISGCRLLWLRVIVEVK